MRNLGNLQQYPSYKGISITEDLTVAERDQYKTWLEKANKKNQDEPNDTSFVWRVRGSPKNGLYLKKIQKKTPML